MSVKKQSLLVSLSLITLLCGTSCVGTTTTDSSFCAIYQPVITTKEDSEATRRQVDDNEVVYACICEGLDKFCGKLNK